MAISLGVKSAKTAQKLPPPKKRGSVNKLTEKPQKTVVKKSTKSAPAATDNKFRGAILDKMMSLLVKKDLGKIYKLSDKKIPTRLKRVVPSGLPGFDLVCAKSEKGDCGLPVGRQIELYGQPNDGKTSLAMAWCAAAQRMGWNVMWQEFENKFDPERAVTLGMDPDSCLFAQPACIEDCVEVIESVFDATPERASLPKDKRSFGTIIVVDSIGQMPSRAEIADLLTGKKKGKRMGMESNNIGKFQLKMAQAQRRIPLRLSKRNVIIVWLNQVRANIQMGFMAGKGDPEKSSGGNAIKFAVAQIWKTGSQKITKNGEKVGQIIYLTNKKNNSCGRQGYLKTEVYLDYAKGFDYIDSWLQACQSLYIAKKVGPNFTFLEGEFKGDKIHVTALRKMYADDPKPFMRYERSFRDYMDNFHQLKKAKSK